MRIDEIRIDVRIDNERIGTSSFANVVIDNEELHGGN